MSNQFTDNLDSRKLKEQSEKRSAEALKLKDEQIMMLMSQNNKHLGDIQEVGSIIYYWRKSYIYYL